MQVEQRTQIVDLLVNRNGNIVVQDHLCRESAHGVEWWLDLWRDCQNIKAAQ